MRGTVMEGCLQGSQWRISRLKPWPARCDSRVFASPVPGWTPEVGFARNIVGQEGMKPGLSLT
jgi:hypothetical protein